MTAAQSIYLLLGSAPPVRVGNNDRQIWPTHRGSHPKYTRAVEAVITKVVAGRDLRDLSNDELLGLFLEIEVEARLIVENWVGGGTGVPSPRNTSKLN